MAAAAAGLVWATLLMCVALGAGERPVENPFFPPGSEPEPVRIYCQENAALNVAERDGNVVLAYGNCSDLRQKWFVVTSPHPSAPFALPPPFALQNAQTFQVIIIPSGSGQKVRLSSEPPINPLDWLSWSRAALEQRWTPEKSTRADHFYQLFVTKSDPALTLNGLLGNVHDGTDVGIFSAAPTSGNAIWQMTSYPLCAR